MSRNATRDNPRTLLVFMAARSFAWTDGAAVLMPLVDLVRVVVVLSVVEAASKAMEPLVASAPAVVAAVVVAAAVEVVCVPAMVSWVSGRPQPGAPASSPAASSPASPRPHVFNAEPPPLSNPVGISICRHCSTPAPDLASRRRDFLLFPSMLQ